MNDKTPRTFDPQGMDPDPMPRPRRTMKVHPPEPNEGLPVEPSPAPTNGYGQLLNQVSDDVCREIQPPYSTDHRAQIAIAVLTAFSAVARFQFTN